ncbi:MAG: ComF family protein [Bacteroidetes bacterium]|nr:ComF family protein [Bacteroidota bacterium]
MKNILSSAGKEMLMMMKSIADFIYPQTCLLTEEYLDEFNSNGFIKDENFSKLYRISDQDFNDLADKVISDYCFSLFAFCREDDFSKIIHNIKYRGMRKLAVYMGELLGLEFKENFRGLKIPDIDLIAPVPLHRARLRERGFNQSELICRGVSKITGIKTAADLLIRVKNTSSQTKLSRNERNKNIESAFILNKKYQSEINLKNIVILDDVITTGSTINEAVRILKESGAGQIISCSLAMARD